MALNLGLLALRASSCPLADIRIDTRPHIPGSNKLLGRSNARVRKVVKGVEDGAAETLWYQWAGIAS